MNVRTNVVAALLLGGLLGVGPVLADKPSWAGKGGKGNSGHEDRAEKHGASNGRGHFEDKHREAARGYYTQNYRGGHCPPGLAKKNNGCMPPGQAKKWNVGRPLPRDVIYYEVPQRLVMQIGPPPAGHRYVRVADDILMLTIGSGMVVDAIRNILG